MATMTLLPVDPIERRSYLLGLRIAGDFGVTIAGPVVIFVLIGQWVDRTYRSAPWATILAFLLAALISGKIVYKKAKDYAQQYKELSEQKQKNK